MKMAILSAGNISRKMANTINALDQIEAYAIAARSLDKAQEFAKEFGFEKAYGSYEEMVNDAQIELVYVSTPHSHHYQHVKLCLEYGKNVICEKPFTVNAKQAKELFDLAKQKGLFLTEALWSRFLPIRTILNEQIESGIIGEVSSISTNFCFPIYDVPRMHKPELAGGALLDLGVYVLNYASMILGNNIEEIATTANITKDGVDSQNAITLRYKNGKIAVLHSSAVGRSTSQSFIHGDKGYIITDSIMNCQQFSVYDLQGKLLKTINAPEQITGFEYEVISSYNAIKNGEKECQEMPHSETMFIMELMDTIRKKWGLVFPCE